MYLKTSDVPFHKRIREQIDDAVMRKAVAMAQERIGANRQIMVDDLGHWEAWRSRGEQIRRHVLENLDAYLYQLSENVTKNGGHVYFASTKAQATDYILTVAKQKRAKKIVKSKSMVTEEIGLNAALQSAGLSVIETDLGEYILQLAHDAPSHDLSNRFVPSLRLGASVIHSRDNRDDGNASLRRSLERSATLTSKRPLGSRPMMRSDSTKRRLSRLPAAHFNHR